MAYDEALYARLRDLLDGTPGLTSRTMFGGVGFMIGGHIAVAASSTGGLMVRVDKSDGEQWIDGEHVHPMEMRGSQLTGWLQVSARSVSDDAALQTWVDRGLACVATLPPKG